MVFIGGGCWVGRLDAVSVRSFGLVSVAESAEVVGLTFWFFFKSRILFGNLLNLGFVVEECWIGRLDVVSDG